jgi:hypothetical protein
VLNITADPKGASMDADLDLLLTAVYVTADDLLPERPEKRHRRGGRHALRCPGDHGDPV